ncbi:RNA elimination defective 1 [Hyphodiscus hymeniophilus]|uniref:RNA elimination defective 1 n=1 Tax=Hyphodiscus hymeniophilus TaxID=353542 RepID=A0A9P7AYL4_9HELO|nr:RNA elimination defective 1 [Hyphodiscus hymeniophilus]
MSDYPQAPPYGAYPQPQPNAPYLQPSYPNQYAQHEDGRNTQTHMAPNFNASAYAYNNSIPGFSAASLAPAPPPLPIYQGWNQDGAPLPSYTNPQSNTPYVGYGYQAPQSYVPPQPQTYQQPTQHLAHYDEGELSEGEFDSYGGQNNGAATSADYGSSYYQGNDAGYMNTAHRAVYSNGQDYSNQHYAPGSDYNNYQRESDSYSPYAAAGPSPLDGSQDERWKIKHNNSVPSATVPERPANGTSWIQTGAPRSSQALSAEVAGNSLKPAANLPLPLHTASSVRNDPTNQGRQSSTTAGPIPHHKPTTEVANHTRKTVSSPKVAQETMAVHQKSVAEYRKKAEGAILNLWSREVRFPDYVEEGLNPDIVGSLFDELGFSKAPKAAVAESKPTAETHDVKTSEGMSVDMAKVNESPHEVGLEPRGILVESNGNNANTTMPALPTAPSAETEPTEKEKNLKMKMEALRKSRAERAQKAAAKTNAPLSVVATTSQPPEPSLSLSAKPSTSNSLTTSPPPTVQPKIDAKSPSDDLPLKNVQSSDKVESSSATAQTIPPPQTVIPGLFLASTLSPAPLSGTTSTMLGGPQSSQRKRPVAADFDVPAYPMPYKRPFGQSRNDSLVIDVSEEEPDSEDEDVAMDLDSQADQDSPLQAAGKLSDQRTAMLQDFPPLTNFPSRRAFMSPHGSAASTPPIITAPRATLGQPQDLQQTEKKIEELKRKIAAAEAAKAAKRRIQKSSSGAATPQFQPNNGASSTTGDGDIASKVEASLQMQQLINVTDDKVANDQKRLAETQVAEQEKAAELKRNEAESRRLRRNTLAADLPRVDAEVEESQRKLQELREAMAKIEASVQKSMDEKKRMAEEMERLGQEAEDQLQEQKDKLESLTRSTISSTSDLPISIVLPIDRLDSEQAGLPSRPALSNADPASTRLTSIPAVPGQAEFAPPRPTSGNRNDEFADTVTVNTTSNLRKDASTCGSEGSRRPSPIGVDHLSSTSDQAQEAALQEQVRAEAESHEQSQEMMDIEDSYAPDPAQLAPNSSSSSVVDSNLAILETQAAVDDGGVVAVTEFEQFSIGRGGLEITAGNDEDELQVTGHPQSEEPAETSNQIQSFTPYESPLKYFRAFRFHPEFKQQVPGGLKSMTFSHQIKPNTEFCRYELAGGVCNDNTCDLQHFRDIALPGASSKPAYLSSHDDAILTTLGNPAEFPAHQQQKFREGLKNLLIELRKRNVRDFDTIALEVLAHRSNFLNDPSKVLMLEGTTI